MGWNQRKASLYPHHIQERNIYVYMGIPENQSGSRCKFQTLFFFFLNTKMVLSMEILQNDHSNLLEEKT